MTTEPPATPPEPTPDPAPEPVVATGAPSAMSSMSGETLVMLGGVLVLASYVIFQLLSGDFFQYITALVAAAFAVLLPLMNADAVAKVARPAALMKILGYVIAVSGVFELLYDVRFGVLDDAMDIIGALVAYAGYALALFGARSIKL